MFRMNGYAQDERYTAGAGMRRSGASQFGTVRDAGMRRSGASQFCTLFDAWMSRPSLIFRRLRRLRRLSYEAGLSHAHDCRDAGGRAPRVGA